MDVILLVVVSVAVGAFAIGVLYLYGAILLYVLLFVIAFWPTAIGITIGALLWRAGHDNLGATVGLLGIIGAWAWARRHGSPPSSGSDRDETVKDILRDIRDRLEDR